MSQQEGQRSPETRRGGRLTIDHPETSKTLATLNLAGEPVADLRRFSNRLQLEADAWRRGGFAERGRISKGDANRLLRLQLAKLAGGAR